MPESRLSPRARAALGWLLAPALAGLAIAAHLAIDVPRAPMLLRDEPKTAGEIAKDKQAKRAERAKQARKRKRRGYEPRDEPTRARLRGRWSGEDIDDEPVNQGFRRRHEALLRSVVTRARVQALAGRRAIPIQIRPTCHTIRCSLELCGPEEMIGDIAELMPQVTVDGASLWHELREVETEPATREDQVCRRWITDFALDGVEVRDLELPEPEE